MQLIVCIVLILLSGFISSSEIAIFSLSRFQLKALRENFKGAHKKIKKLLNDPSGLLVSLLVAGEVVNISLCTLITESIAAESFELPQFLEGVPYWAYETFLGIICTSPVVLILCEMTPKIIGAQINQLVAPLCVGPLSALYYIFSPLRRVLKGVMGLIAPDTVKADPHSGRLNEAEFLLLVEEGRKEGVILQGELDLIHNVFHFDDTTVSEIATPLAQVMSLPATTTLKQALSAIRTRRYSRIPIVSQNKKEVLGVLYAKDLLKLKLYNDPGSVELTVADLMKKPFFVAPELRLNTVFRRFKRNKIHMAIIKSESGTVTGVITMNDLLDYLFEDFFQNDDTSAIPLSMSPTQTSILPSKSSSGTSTAGSGRTDS